MSTELATADAPDLDTMKVVKDVVVWNDERAQMQKLAATAKTITVTSAADKAGMELARRTRLSFRAFRLTVEDKRKELVTDGKRKLAAIDKDAGAIWDFCEQHEAQLKEMEEFAERETAKQKAALKLEREADLAPYTQTPALYNVADMTFEQFEELRMGLKAAQDQKIENERKAEVERIAKEKAEAEERERVRLENERLKKEAAEMEQAAHLAREEADAKLKAERDRADAEAAKAKAEADERARIAAVAAKAERDKLEAARKVEQAKAAEAIRLAGEKAKVEREAREKLEREAAEKRAEEEKKIADDLAAQEQAAKAPDREKLLTLAAAVRNTPLPEMKTKDGRATLALLSDKIDRLADDIQAEAEEL